jgi:hypothetical protein
LRSLRVEHLDERVILNLAKIIPELENLSDLHLFGDFREVLDIFQTSGVRLLPSLESVYFGNDYSLADMMSTASFSGIMKFSGLKGLQRVLLTESFEFPQSSLEILVLTLDDLHRRRSSNFWNH